MILRCYHGLLALALLAACHQYVAAFQPQHQQQHQQRTQQASARRRATIPSVSVSSTLEGFSDDGEQKKSFLKTLSEQVEDEEDLDETELNLKRKRVKERSGVFQVDFCNIQEQPLGFSLCQMDTGGKLSELQFDLDSNLIRASPATDTEARQFMDRTSVRGRLGPGFSGLVVASVVEDSPAWKGGVRPGDVVVSSSATIGDALWPKSTLEGVRSALTSRRVVAASISFEFQRVTEKVDNQYELTLTRPIGIEIQETQDGYVQVTGFTEKAAKMVKYAIQIGDRVVAVDSSLGDRMWPVSTVEGVISACTGRIPGQPVRMRFERPAANVKTLEEADELVADELASPTEAVAETPVSNNAVVVQDSQATVAAQSPAAHRELRSRCRDVLRRYGAEANGEGAGQTFKGKYAVPAIVADKVVDALASASASLDSVTLSMVMKAYLSCDQPEDAIRIFEASVGFSGDGSASPAKHAVMAKNGGRIMPSESALNLFTATALLQAHAASSNMDNVSRVLAALEGQSGVVIAGLESAPWPWTGPFGTIKPDTQCYNICLAVAIRSADQHSVDTALKLFEKMSDRASDDQPQRDLVTYNTIISAVSKAGRADEAFRLFSQMRRAGIHPDVRTYTSLVKVCSRGGDVEELFYDMEERGIETDVSFYNAIIRSLCESRQWTEASKLVSDMESRGILPDSKTYGLLMNAMLKADKPTACLTLFESACANERTAALTQNVHLYTTAITATSLVGDAARALEFVSRMTAAGVKPNLKTLTAVMGACLASDRADLAVEVYRRIGEPDGYATAQGIQAFCKAGDLAAASDLILKQDRRGRSMSGKMIMLSYQRVISASLERRDYSMARTMLTDLLSKAFIPNKAMLRSIIDAKPLDMAVEDAPDRFAFLLFVLDSLQKRNLPVDGGFYASVLFLGRNLSGRSKKLASLLVQARTSTKSNAKEIMSHREGDEGNVSFSHTWEELLHSSHDLDLSPDDLRPLFVRVNGRASRIVMTAEQSVAAGLAKKTKAQKPAQA